MINNRQEKFTFEISLSVLNHLGRNLYRNFITVLGEAISNSWDADANNVWIYIDRKKGSLVVKDDGIGMTSGDFAEKFLKVGYSKRKNGDLNSKKGRPFIGAKGIGKLALLSSADTISIISKTVSTDYIGGVIDNSELDEKIKDDVKPNDYPLGVLNMKLFTDYINGHKKGTIIYFKNVKEDIRNTVEYLKKMIALHFKFSVIDEGFNIYINDKLITLDNIRELSEKTEILWNINASQDEYFNTLTKLEHASVPLTSDLGIDGFIATVEKPRNLKITGTEERVGIDLFVNGRLREKDLMKHIPTARVVESYMYGQIHYDVLDRDGVDRFTSSREGVQGNDEKYQALLNELKINIIPQILTQWDDIRLQIGKDGDDDDPRKTPKARRARSLYNLSSSDYKNSGDNDVNDWIKDFLPDAEFNISAYVDCFLSENLLRKYIKKKELKLNNKNYNAILDYKDKERTSKENGNISFGIRENENDTNYLEMGRLAETIDGHLSGQLKKASLIRDANEYTPIRNAVGHTALLTKVAKTKLNLVYENIKSRINTLLSSK